MMIIGIDPGERWTGMAFLRTRKSTMMTAEIGIIDGSQNRYLSVELLNEEIEDEDEVHVVCEDYVVRPVGHQRFTHAYTVRVIGALEYVTHFHRKTWDTLPAGDPDKQLKLLGLSNLFIQWSMEWPERNRPQWHHGRAAWRVLAQWLLASDPDLLQRMKMMTIQGKPIRPRKKIGPNGLWAHPIYIGGT
jgi:hypothetical protein